jgi:hypothetical protein
MSFGSTKSKSGINGFMNVHLVIFDPKNLDLCQSGLLRATFYMTCAKFVEALTFAKLATCDKPRAMFYMTSAKFGEAPTTSPGYMY